MKKFLGIAVSLVMILVCSISVLCGCHLVEVDDVKDMNQVVATVNIGKEDKVYKKDIVVAYMNYGSLYEQYYGYTRAQVIELIVKNLIETRVIIQNALDDFDKGEVPFDTVYKNPAISDKWDVLRYLTEREINDAKYDTYKSIDDMIKSYAKLSTEKVDTKNVSSRAVPTNASKKEISDAEKDAFVSNIDANGFDFTGSRRKAFKLIENLLKANGLLGKDYDGADLRSTDYCKNSIESGYENAIITKYENTIKNYARKSLLTDFSVLENAFNEKKAVQKEFNATEFAELMSSASASSPLLYGAYGNYGYVYNLLLGVDDIQKQFIADIDNTLTAEQKRVERANILKTTVAVDLRAGWIYDGYDFDYDESEKKVTFTGDYTFNSTYSLPFQGTVERVREKTEDLDAMYSVKDITRYQLNDFVSFFENYIANNEGSSPATVNTVALSSGFEYTESVYKKAKFEGGVEAYRDKINELLFAFSTDSGALNTYRGYAVSPKPDGEDSETYVAEFAAAARELIKDGNENSYIIVATEFGYHVIFFSKVFGVGAITDQTFVEYLNECFGSEKDQAGWTEYFNAMLNNWDDFENTDFYMYLLADEISTAQVGRALSEKERSLINTYINEDTTGRYVKKYPSTYADLLG